MYGVVNSRGLFQSRNLQFSVNTAIQYPVLYHKVWYVGELGCCTTVIIIMCGVGLLLNALYGITLVYGGKFHWP